MNDEVRVYVVSIAGRKNLVFRWQDKDGNIQQKSARTTRKRDAEREAARLSEKLTKQQQYARKSWATLREQFEREHVDRLTWRGRSSYRTALNRIEDLCDPASSEDITNGLLSMFVAECQAEELSPNTIKGYLRHLHRFWQFLIDNGHIPQIPKVTAPKPSKVNRGRPLTTEEFERILSCCRGEYAADWRFDLTALWLSGLRLSEAVILRWETPTEMSFRHFSRRDPVLWIPATWDKSSHESWTQLTPDLVEYLRDHTTADSRDGLVFNFRSKNGSRLSRVDTVSKIVAQICRRAGVVSGQDHRGGTVYASAHDFRRSFGARWAPEVEAVVLQKMMRHKSISTTLTYYAHVDAVRIGEKIREAYESRLSKNLQCELL